MSSPPTSGIRRPTPTARSTASTGATTGSSRSIRWSTPRKRSRIPVLDPKMPPGKPQSMPVPSPYWGTKLYWFDPAITNHAAMDSKGRVWMSSRFRRAREPAVVLQRPSLRARSRRCRRASGRFSTTTRRRSSSSRSTSASTSHHVQFASDADETIYGNGPFSGAIGWVNTRKLEATGDAGAAQGWCRPWFDVNGDGKIDRAVDREIKVGLFYSVIPHPTTAASGARCRDRCRGRSFASIRRPASAKRTSRPSIRPPASSATRRAASTSIRTA